MLWNMLRDKQFHVNESNSTSNHDYGRGTWHSGLDGQRSQYTKDRKNETTNVKYFRN